MQWPIYDQIPPTTGPQGFQKNRGAGWTNKKWGRIPQTATLRYTFWQTSFRGRKWAGPVGKWDFGLWYPIWVWKLSRKKTLVFIIILPYWAIWYSQFSDPFLDNLSKMLGWNRYRKFASLGRFYLILMILPVLIFWGLFWAEIQLSQPCVETRLTGFYIFVYPLVMADVAIENGHFPIKNCDFP